MPRAQFVFGAVQPGRWGSRLPSPSPSPSPRTLEPEWNELLDFKGVHVREATSLAVSVYDADLIGRDDFLGELP